MLCSTASITASIYRGGGNLTLFTPTFNRSEFLLRIYDDLLGQTCKDFVWLVVDDGSTDDTPDVMDRLLKENKIPVKYIRKANGGKHSAFKIALDNCITDYFQCMDDDDIYAPDAVEFFLSKWQEIKSQGREDIGAIRTLSQRKDGTYVADFKISETDIGKEYDATTLEMNYILRKHMENWTCYDTNKLRSVELFPTNYWMSTQHKFYIERLWQGRFARKYKCRYIYTALRTYCDDAPTNLTTRKVKSRQHYIDAFLNAKMLNDEQMDYMMKVPKQFIKSVIKVVLLSSYLNISLHELFNNTPSVKLKILYTIFSPARLFANTIMESKVN